MKCTRAVTFENLCCFCFGVRYMTETSFVVMVTLIVLAILVLFSLKVRKKLYIF